MHPAAIDIEQLLQQCDVRREKRSGPGGQHRNKVETAVVLTHRPTKIKGDASERRSQAQNHRVAVFRLRVNLALNVRCPLADDYSPSPCWIDRRSGGRIAVSTEHDDFPALLAEALDVLHAHDFEMKAAADVLGITTSQLTKFLQLEPQAIAQINDRRSQLGLRPLR